MTVGVLVLECVCPLSFCTHTVLQHAQLVSNKKPIVLRNVQSVSE